MKNKTLMSILLCGILAAFSPKIMAATLLSDFSSSIGIDTLTFSTTTRTITGTQVVGALFNEGTGPWDVFSFAPTAADIRVTLTGFATTNPFGGFQITLEDGVGKLIAADFSWASFTTTSTDVTAVFSQGALSDFNTRTVTTWNLVSGANSNPINATFTSLSLDGATVAIPEPSVASLLALGTVGLVVLRARRKS
jgi:hypothetical protein